MALSYGFFNSVESDRVYTADQMSEYFKGLVSERGVYENVGDRFSVVPGGGMSVNVNSGRLLIDYKWLENDGIENRSITEAHPTLNRYSMVVARLDYSGRRIIITTQNGTPAMNPSRPTLTRNSSVYEICLALVYVRAQATAITQADIYDTRPDNDLCGWVTGVIQQVDTSDLFLQWQTAYADFYNSFQSWFETLTSQLQVNTYINSYRKVQALESGANVISLDMDGYTYDANDVVMVYVNGLKAVEGVDYTLAAGSPATINLTVTYDRISNTAEVVAIKSKIGDPVSAGSSFGEMEIADRVQSLSTITVETEV